MSVLSIRNRVEYAAIGIAIIGSTAWLAYHMLQTEGPQAGGAATILVLFGLAFRRALMVAPPNISLSTWWYRSCRKLDISCVDGTWYYSSFCDLRTWVLYDRDGYLVGWHGQNREGYPFFKPASDVHGDTRHHGMKFISRLRSPKLPVPQAEVQTADGDVIGYTDYMVR